MKSKYLDPSKKNAIIAAFSSLPYKILWKFEDDTMKDQPANVRISKWLPQQDLLGHPNIKLFITQGGSQSMEEAVANGVPLLVIPFIADQYANAERIEKLEIGLKLDYNGLTEATLQASIKEIVENAR